MGCGSLSQHQHSFTVKSVLFIKNLAVREILSSRKSDTVRLHERASRGPAGV